MKKNSKLKIVKKTNSKKKVKGRVARGTSTSARMKAMFVTLVTEAVNSDTPGTLSPETLNEALQILSEMPLKQNIGIPLHSQLGLLTKKVDDLLTGDRFDGWEKELTKLVNKKNRLERAIKKRAVAAAR